MALSYSQRATATTTFSGATLDATFGSSTTSGNAIIVAVAVNQPADAISSITDNKGNTFYKALSVFDSGVGEEIEIWYALNITGGSGHIVTTNHAIFLSVFVNAEEWSGVGLVGALDRVASNAGTSTTFDSGSTSSTRTPNELIFGASFKGGVGTVTVGSGYSNFTTVGVGLSIMATESKVVSSSGTYNATFDCTNSRSYLAVVATFSDTNATTTTSTSSSTSTSTSTSSTSTSTSTSVSTSSTSSSTSTSQSTSTSISTSSTSTSISTSTSLSTSSTSSSTSQSTSTSLSTSSTSTSTTQSMTTSTSSTSTSLSTSSTSTSVSTSTSISTSSTSTSQSTSTSSTSSSTSKSTSTSSTSTSQSTSTTQSFTTSTSSTSSSTSSTSSSTSSTSTSTSSTTTLMPDETIPTMKQPGNHLYIMRTRRDEPVIK